MLNIVLGTDRLNNTFAPQVSGREISNEDF